MSDILLGYLMSWLPQICMAIFYRKQTITLDQDLYVHRQLHRDAAAALVGSLGLVPSINAGDDFVMGEPYVPLLEYRKSVSSSAPVCMALRQTSPDKELQTPLRPSALLLSCLDTLDMPLEQADST